MGTSKTNPIKDVLLKQALDVSPEIVQHYVKELENKIKLLSTNDNGFEVKSDEKVVLAPKIPRGYVIALEDAPDAMVINYETEGELHQKFNNRMLREVWKKQDAMRFATLNIGAYDLEFGNDFQIAFVLKETKKRFPATGHYRVE
jgi:hypothetical protein